MIITDVNFKKIDINLYEPFRVAFADIASCENILVQIKTDEGIIGYGEAAPLAFVTGETAESVISILNILKPGLIGMNPLALDSIHKLMNSVTGGNSSAKCAIDLALYDIKGKAMNKPVYQILGGDNNIVQNDMTIGIDKPEIMAAKAKMYSQEKGFNILKIKAGRNPKEDIKALTLIREAVGDKIRLRVDANQGYSVSQAIYVLDPFTKLGIEAIEQCLPDWDFEGSAYVKDKARGIQIMLDESIHLPRDAAKAGRLNAADILNIKLMKCGGLYPAQQIGYIADAFGLECMVGCMLETRLSITAGLSLVAAKSNITEADCDSFLYFDENTVPVSGGFTIENDLFKLSDKPGFGVDVDFESI